MAIEGLTVERRTDPLGIDRPEPRFAWRDSNARQVAYQLELIDTDDPNATWSAPTWDSGRVASTDSTYVAYGGPPLVSRHRYSWRAGTYVDYGWIGERVEYGGFLRHGSAFTD
jgi:alpha-L-rhamnosidase